MEQSRIDWPSFAICALILIGASIPLFVYPDASEAVSYTHLTLPTTITSWS